eukprot:scaffold161082_cov53-Attheya_sp.AAC.4
MNTSSLRMYFLSKDLARTKFGSRIKRFEIVNPGKFPWSVVSDLIHGGNNMFSTMNVIRREHRLRTVGVHYFPAAKKVSSKCEAVMDEFG